MPPWHHQLPPRDNNTYAPSLALTESEQSDMEPVCLS